MPASHDSRKTFVRVSHDVRANLNQFCFSKWSYLCRIFVALCRSRKLPCEVFANVCEGRATGWRRVGDEFATYAMTWRRFCDDFCRIKKYYMFKALANRSRRVRDACEDFATPCERFETVRDGFAN